MSDTPVKTRLFAHPRRQRSYANGGRAQVGDPAPTPAAPAPAPAPSAPAPRQSIDHLIRQAAKRYHIDERIFRAQLNAESGLRENVTSRQGARDIAQFIPSTAKAYGVTLGDNNPADDIDGAARYMRDNLNRVGGDYRKALSIYNSGRPDGYKSIAETAAYVQKIMGAAGSRPGPAMTLGSGTPATTGGTPQPTTNPADRSAAVLQWLAARKAGSRSQALLGLAGALNNAPMGTTSVPATPTSSTPRTPSAPSRVNTSQTGPVDDPSGKQVAAWIEPILAYAREHGWKGTVNSGYRSDEEQTRIYKSGVRPAALPQSMGGGGSNHEFTGYPGGAVDVTDPQTLARILRNSRYRNKLQYAGSKDPVHFSHPHNGSY